MAWLKWLKTSEAPPRVEEAPFVPFDLAPLRAEAQALAAAAAAAEAEHPPGTLAELGVPSELAHDLEVVLRAMGRTEGGQVIGFRFRSPDGSSRAIRLQDAA